LNIEFSRHALRRIKLYGISESDVKKIIAKSKKLNKGYNEIIEPVPNFKYPIKVVLTREDDYLTIITAYPLKRGLK